MKLRIKEFVVGWMRTWTPVHTRRLILLVGLVHGLIYVFAVPLWWHYDEASHFEYAWLMANRPGIPAPGVYDEGLHRLIAESMLKSGWYRIQNYTPDLAGTAPVWIGGITAVEPPAYYVLPSLVLRLMHNANIDLQLYSMRLFSLALFLLSLFLAWKILEMLFRPGNPVLWTVPLFMALLPGYLDTMTSANNDAGAVVAFSLFLWVSLRLLKNKFSIWNLLWAVLAAGLCYLTKRTVWIAIGLLPFVILFSVLHGRAKRFMWAAIILGVIVGLCLTLSWGDAAYWYQVSRLPEPTRAKVADAPSGKYAIQILADTSSLGQFISPSTATSLQGAKVTLGVWVWANQPINVALPVIRFVPDTESNSFQDSSPQLVTLTNQPVFHTVMMTVPQHATRGMIVVAPVEQASPGTKIYYDGFSLANGEFSTAPPSYQDTGDRSGIWDGKPFENLIRNGSAELGWLNVRPWVVTLTNDVRSLHGQIPLILASLQDWQGIGWYYLQVAAQFSNTFWSQLADNKVHLPGRYSQPLLRIILLIGLVGVVGWCWRKRRLLPWDIVFVLAAAVVIIWGLDFVRGAPELLLPGPAVPWARYAFPVIIPTALILCVGWLEVIRLLRRWMGFSEFAANSILSVFLVGLDLYTFLALIIYFYPKLLDVYYILLFIGLLILIFLLLWVGKQKLDEMAKKEPVSRD